MVILCLRMIVIIKQTLQNREVFTELKSMLKMAGTFLLDVVEYRDKYKLAKALTFDLLYVFAASMND